LHCTGQRDGGKLDGGRERTVLCCNGDEIVATGESWAALPWRVREHYSGRELSGIEWKTRAMQQERAGLHCREVAIGEGWMEGERALQ